MGVSLHIPIETVCICMYVYIYIYYIYMYISWHICLKLLYNTVYVWITETRWSIGLAHILGILLIYDMRPLKQIQLYTTIVHIYIHYLSICLSVCLSVCLSIYLSKYLVYTLYIYTLYIIYIYTIYIYFI